MLAIAGMIALTFSAHLFGTPLSPIEKRRASDEWNRKTDAYRLPISLETITATIFFLGGIGILGWSKFNLCAFLAHWLPSLPETVRLLLSCR
jgi:predicted small integral membrane protein